MPIVNFIKQYLLHMIIYLSLIFVYVYNSTIALIICGVFIHVILGIAIHVLYIDKSTIPKNISCKRILYAITEVIIMLAVFGIKGHWYFFIVILIYSILSSINVYEKYKGVEI